MGKRKNIVPDATLEAEMGEDDGGGTSEPTPKGMKKSVPLLDADVKPVFKTPPPRTPRGRPANKKSKKPAVPEYLNDDPPFVERSPLEFCKAKEDLNADGWSSGELSTLYSLLKQFGTGDASLEYLSATGLERSYQDISAKVEEIRELNRELKAERRTAYMEHCAKIGDACTNDIELARKMPVGDVKGIKWTSAILTTTCNYRKMNTSHVRNAIIDSIGTLSSNKHDAVKATHDQSARRPDTKMSLDYGKIKQYLQSAVNGKIKHGISLNPLESAVILKITDDVKKEARQKLQMQQKAQIRGLFRTVKRGQWKQLAPEYPCNELNATQLFLDPLRTRDFNLPPGGRELTTADVDARHPQETAPAHRDEANGGEPMDQDEYDGMRLLTKREAPQAVWKGESHVVEEPMNEGCQIDDDAFEAQFTFAFSTPTAVSGKEMEEEASSEPNLMEL